MLYSTKQREILLNFFSKNPDKNFSAEEIAKQLKNQDISLSAVYRNLSELEKMGKVRKTAKSGSRKSFFQYVDLDDCKGHLHLSCKECGKTLHLDDNSANILVQNILKNANFNVDKDSTILFGICKNCDKNMKKC